MIYVDREQCTGCALCLEACSTGALALRDNVTFIDQEHCEGCQACVDVCPAGAILVAEIVPAEEDVSTSIEAVSAPPVEIINQQPQPDSPGLGAVVGTALLDVAPRLIHLAVDWLERRATPIVQNNIIQNQTSPQRRVAAHTDQRLGRGRKAGRRRRWRGRNRNHT
jgi:ferredoxin